MQHKVLRVPPQHLLLLLLLLLHRDRPPRNHSSKEVLRHQRWLHQPLGACCYQAMALCNQLPRQVLV
jgi:hypothetical protein